MAAAKREADRKERERVKALKDSLAAVTASSKAATMSMAEMREILEKMSRASGGIYSGSMSPGGLIPPRPPASYSYSVYSDPREDFIDDTTLTGGSNRAGLSPQQALDVILDAIRKTAGGDPDNMLKLTGIWISKITNALAELNKEIQEQQEPE